MCVYAVNTGRCWRDVGWHKARAGRGPPHEAAPRVRSPSPSLLSRTVAALLVLLASPLDRTFSFLYEGRMLQMFPVDGTPRPHPRDHRTTNMGLELGVGAGGGVSIQIPTGHPGSSRNFLAPIESLS